MRNFNRRKHRMKAKKKRLRKHRMAHGLLKKHIKMIKNRWRRLKRVTRNDLFKCDLEVKLNWTIKMLTQQI